MKNMNSLIYSIRRAYLKSLLTNSKFFSYVAVGLNDKQSKYIADLLNMQFQVIEGRTVFSAPIDSCSVYRLDQKLDGYLSKFMFELCIETCFIRLECCINQKVRPPNWVIAALKCLPMDRSGKEFKLLETVMKEYPELIDIVSFKDMISIIDKQNMEE